MTPTVEEFVEIVGCFVGASFSLCTGVLLVFSGVASVAKIMADPERVLRLARCAALRKSQGGGFRILTVVLRLNGLLQPKLSRIRPTCKTV